MLKFNIPLPELPINSYLEPENGKFVSKKHSFWNLALEGLNWHLSYLSGSRVCSGVIVMVLVFPSFFFFFLSLVLLNSFHALEHAKAIIKHQLLRIYILLSFISILVEPQILEHGQTREKRMKSQNKYFTLEDDPVHNDFMREMTFYRQAQATVLQGFSKLEELGLPTVRPSDYFAEMAKSDDHMQKVGQVLYVLHFPKPYKQVTSMSYTPYWCEQYREAA